MTDEPSQALAPTPIDRDSIPEIVYQTLRRDIARGLYPPGVLRIRPLAERFGVSATPIREALRRLEAEGLVELRNRRIMVRGVSRSELDEIFAIRIVLERFAIAEAARLGAEDGTWDALDALVADMDAAVTNDLERWRAANEELHMRIYGLARNPRLLAIIDSLWVAVEPYLRLYVHAGADLAVAQDEHRAIVAALRDGDGDRAADLLERHLSTTQEIVRRGVDNAALAGA